MTLGLGAFILERMDHIISEWAVSTASLPPASVTMDDDALREHGRALLQGMAQALSGGQFEALLSVGNPLQPAMVLALRSTVLRLWAVQAVAAPHVFQDIVFFNDWLDEAAAESAATCTRAEQLIQRQKLDTLGHDMRNPLGVIVMTAGYLSRLKLDRDGSEAVERLMRSAARIEVLLNDLVHPAGSDLDRT